MSDSKPIIAPLSGIARPTRALRNRIGKLYSPGETREITAMMDDFVAVDALARLLTEGIDKVTTKDGRLDTKDLAAFVLRHMRKDGR